MMNEIMVMNGEFGRVRTMAIENDVWFVGKDIAECLGYKDTSDALKKHVDEDDKMGGQNTDPYIIDTLGRKQYPTFINESGLYSLVLSSKLPSAKKFKKWITSEVLPSIRKHGIYATDNTIENIIENPDFAIQLLTKLKEERAEKLRLEELNRKQQPKVEVYDVVFEDKYYDSRTLANMLNTKGMGRNNLLAFLREKGILDSNNVPYRQYVEQGYAKQIPTTKVDRYGNIIMKTVFSDKMLKRLVKHFGADR